MTLPVLVGPEEEGPVGVGRFLKVAGREAAVLCPRKRE
jgi:hypothetical protein